MYFSSRSLVVVATTAALAVGSRLPERLHQRSERDVVPLEGQIFPQPSAASASTSTPLEGQVFTDHPPAPTSAPVKKGAGVWAAPKLDANIEELGVSWAYAWSPAPGKAFTDLSLSPPAGVQLVPLVTTEMNTPETFASLRGKGYQAVLGFNEPDAGVASISPADAAKAWSDFVATGLRVGSPAPVHTKLVPGDWFYDFMNLTKAQGSRVDFIALHYYAAEFDDVDTAVANFKAYIQRVRDVYRLSIWVTGFAMISRHADPSHWNLPDEATQGRFLTAACQMLNDLPYVEKYAWLAVPQNETQPAMNLLDSQGNFTPLGNLYKAV
ncbi:MAG: hypothetical protein Q9195_002673 [Heterodermia aff. obscurata]